MSHLAFAIIATVALQRLAELTIAHRNTTRLKAQGATEIGAGHYPLIVCLHAAWLAAIALFLPATPRLEPIALILFGLLQIARIWVLASLGPYFTTRIITLPRTPLVRSGPYRFVRHPNYLIVAGEIFLLPLGLGEFSVALVFSIANALMLL